MNPEAQRIAIAEARGWKHRLATIENPVERGGMRLPNSFGPSIEAWWHDEHPGVYGDPARYLTDLNAILVAVRALPNDEQWNCFAILAKIVSADVPAATATAEEWSQAYLRTIGKWEDDK